MQILKYLLVAIISAGLGYGTACMMFMSSKCSRQEELNIYELKNKL